MSTPTPSPTATDSADAVAAHEHNKPSSTAKSGAKIYDAAADAAGKDKASPRRSDEAASVPGSPARKKQKMYTPLLPKTSSRSRVYQYTSSSTKSNNEDVKLNFAQRLMELLEKDDVKPVLHWMEDGRRICIKDPGRFAIEVMPKYFSDTKYKSFMVRMKRWGFTSITPKDLHSPAKVMECELFRRDQPELCLLMGDERRVERINVAKAITKTADDKLDGQTRSNATTLPVASTVASASTTLADAGGVLRPTATASEELAMLQYHRNLQNMATYNMLSGRYPGSSASRGGLLSDFTSPTLAAAASLRGLTASSLLGMGEGLQGLHPHELQGERGMRAIADTSLLSIEQDIRYCLETIAIHQDRLVMLQNLKEMKYNLAGSRSGGGLGPLLTHHRFSEEP